MRNRKVFMGIGLLAALAFAGCGGSSGGGGVSYQGSTDPAMVSGAGQAAPLGQGSAVQADLSLAVPCAIGPSILPAATTLAARPATSMGFTDTVAGPNGGSYFIDVEDDGTGTITFSSFVTSAGQTLDGEAAIAGFTGGGMVLTFDDLSLTVWGKGFTAAGMLTIASGTIAGVRPQVVPLPDISMEVNDLVIRDDESGLTTMLDEALVEVSLQGSYNYLWISGTVDAAGAKFFHPDLGWVYVKTDTFVGFNLDTYSYGRFQLTTEAGGVFWITFSMSTDLEYRVMVDDGDATFEDPGDTVVESGTFIDGVFTPDAS